MHAALFMYDCEMNGNGKYEFETIEAAAVIVPLLVLVVVVAVPVPKAAPPVVVAVCTPTVPVHVCPVGQHLRLLVRASITRASNSRYVVRLICCANRPRSTASSSIIGI